MTDAIAYDTGLLPAAETGSNDQTLEPVFLIFWGLCALVGVALATVGGLPIAGGAFLVLITVPAVTWKPLFGLCLYAFALPVARGYAVAGISPARAVGALFLLGFLANTLFTSRHLRIRSSVPIIAILIFVIGSISAVWASYPMFAMRYAFTLLQIAILTVMVLTLVRSQRAIVWVLRAFVAGCLMAFALATVTGRGAYGERLTVGMGPERDLAQNPNVFGVVMALGTLCAMYLIRRDPARFLRICMLPISLLFLVAMLMSGSRQAILALFAAIAAPLLLVRQVASKPHRFIGLILLLVVLGGFAMWSIDNLLPDQVAHRLGDPGETRGSMSERLALFRDGISTAISKPVGVGLGMYRSAHGVAAHNDFVFLITSLGFVGGALYIGLFLLMAIRLWKAPPTAERWLAIALVTCVFISGNASQYILAQHPWMFLTIAWLATDPHLMPASNAAAIEDYELSYEQPGAFA